MGGVGVTDMNVTSPLKFLSETFVFFTKIFVKRIIEPWIDSCIKTFSQLSKINVWNKPSFKMEQIYNGGE